MLEYQHEHSNRRHRGKTFAEALAELRAKVKVGVDQLDRWEGAEWKAIEIKTKGRALAAARKSFAV